MQQSVPKEYRQVISDFKGEVTADRKKKKNNNEVAIGGKDISGPQ